MNYIFIRLKVHKVRTSRLRWIVLMNTVQHLICNLICIFYNLFLKLRLRPIWQAKLVVSSSSLSSSSAFIAVAKWQILWKFLSIIKVVARKKHWLTFFLWTTRCRNSYRTITCTTRSTPRDFASSATETAASSARRWRWVVRTRATGTGSWRTSRTTSSRRRRCAICVRRPAVRGSPAMTTSSTGSATSPSAEAGFAISGTFIY